MVHEMRRRGLYREMQPHTRFSGRRATPSSSNAARDIFVERTPIIEPPAAGDVLPILFPPISC
jgi:hypothetical protein